MSFDEGTKYKASNGQVFIIKHFMGTDWEIKEFTDAGYSDDNDWTVITATSYSGCVAWIEKEIKEEEESRAIAEERRAQTEYKASNGQVFFINHDWRMGWTISQFTDDAYISCIITATSYSECVACIENVIKKTEGGRFVSVGSIESQKITDRVTELKQAFEASGRKQNYADPSEMDNLNLTLTEKKIMQQCKRPKCNGCKLGWICPKFWSE